MALIVGFPDLASKAALDDADLNSALNKIVEQIGGVDADGVQRPGSLDLANHVAQVGWRNAQKAEPRALVPVVFAGDGGVFEAVALPLELAIRSVTAVVSHNVNRVKSLRLTFKADGVPFLALETPAPAVDVSQAYAWEAGGRIAAGARLTVEATLEMDNANGYFSAITVALWCAADHVE